MLCREPTWHFVRCFTVKCLTARFESLELFRDAQPLANFVILVVVGEIRVQTPIGVTLNENIERRQRFS